MGCSGRGPCGGVTPASQGWWCRRRPPGSCRVRTGWVGDLFHDRQGLVDGHPLGGCLGQQAGDHLAQGTGLGVGWDGVFNHRGEGGDRGALGEVITGLLAKTPTRRMPIDQALAIMKQITDKSDALPAAARRPTPTSSTRSADATLPVTPGLRHHFASGRNNPYRQSPVDTPAQPEMVRTSTHDPNRLPARRTIWRRLRSRRP